MLTISPINYQPAFTGKGGKNGGVRKFIEKAKNHIKENKDEYIATGAGIGAVGAYGAVLHSYVKSSKATEVAAEASGDWERVKILSGGDYIERVGDHYNLVHFGYDGAPPFTVRIKPEEYDFYGLKPLSGEAVPSVGETADAITEAAASNWERIKILPNSGGDYIERVGDQYNLVHFDQNGGSVTFPVKPEEYEFYGLEPLAKADDIDASLSELGHGLSHSSEVFNSMLDLKTPVLGETLQKGVDISTALTDANGVPQFDPNDMPIPGFGGGDLVDPDGLLGHVAAAVKEGVDFVTG